MIKITHIASIGNIFKITEMNIHEKITHTEHQLVTFSK